MNKITFKFLFFCAFLIILSCNKKENHAKKDRNPNEVSNLSNQKTNVKKVLFFDDVDPSNKGIKFTFSGNDIEWSCDDSEFMEKVYLENGLLKTSDNSTVFVIDGETLKRIDGSGYDMRYLFNRKKSTNDINEVLHPNENNINQSSNDYNSNNQINKPSYSEIRGSIIQGSKNTVMNFLGKPDSEMYGNEYIGHKLYNCDRIGGLVGEGLSYYEVWTYSSPDNTGNELLVIFHKEIISGKMKDPKVNKVMYSKDIHKFNDLYN